MELADDGLVATHEQFVFAAVMHIKGGAPDVGAIDDVLYRDRVIATFADQVGQRLLQQFAGALYSPVSLRHEAFSDEQAYCSCVGSVAKVTFPNNSPILFTN